MFTFTPQVLENNAIVFSNVLVLLIPLGLLIFSLGVFLKRNDTSDTGCVLVLASPIVAALIGFALWPEFGKMYMDGLIRLVLRPAEWFLILVVDKNAWQLQRAAAIVALIGLCLFFWMKYKKVHQ